MNYYLFTIEYDGTDFYGWAKQKNQPTIQGEIEKAISKVARNSKFRIVGASKTDSGVHAKDQKAWVELNFKPNILGFLSALNKTLPLGITIKKIKEINKDFRVRNCRKKTYIYVIKLKETNVFENRFYFFANYEINVFKLKEALDLFIGKHNFLNFSGLKKQELEMIETIRTIDFLNLETFKNKLNITFQAKGFIRYQIRMIMGACLAYSRDKITLKDIKDTLELKRQKLPFIANPEGLTLKKIDY
ncbi:tRNA pseudouridine(38-40) synthase TruA [Spiroplasma taiwanense]|uniref:tRNA pseudouridine synthase A n=1 Tax=Spiroplasma taiwanense CT-1 TaxID=1276220 RepID=S5MCY6_9MOLU|nr:tRNA pseudouridine(38-40) synthase TruA [Spiroplasma taiwanense]AGR41583.1 tRNA pseudouridine synthase A [Spiroplasma taiwanense CT-1]